ncbi:MAG: shikimate dehydrogenase [Saprospirales bacterium]|nr:shikimate dehydrogenase [Saprospirales bacterium]
MQHLANPAQYGLIGYPLGHSFSQRYFTEKFSRDGITGARYDLFPLPDIAGLPALVGAHPDLCGLNVTIPHKVTAIRYLHELDETAQAVGAVNTIRIRNGRLTGFNTDATGFEQSLSPWLVGREPGLVAGRIRALILGTGGASRAIAFALRRLGIDFTFVSRHPGAQNHLSYEKLHTLTALDYTLIVNTTPLGMYPEQHTCPDLPFSLLDHRHFVYDLVYNPAETLLLQRSKARGAAVKNGLEMLHLQAEAAWAIWQD